jgi:glycosyltransferase involved in cell wall biosynthesis
MKLAWVSVYNAEDPNVYDGRGYYLPLSLKNQSVFVEYVGSLTIPKIYQPYFYVKRHLSYNRFIKSKNKKSFYVNESTLLLKNYANQISKKMSKLSNLDVVCSGVVHGSQPIAYLECDRPIVIWTDATFLSTLDFYPGYFKNEICKESMRDGIANDRAAFNRCSLAIFPSQWAAQEAIEQYQLPPSKVKVVPFGANLYCDRKLEDIKSIVDSRTPDKIKLLFLGVDWYRKGGDTAFEIAKELNNAGFPTELTIVGCQPSLDEPLPDFVRCLGYLSNATQEGRMQLDKVLAESHFLVVPSRAETFGHVFCEASSFGLPSITTNIGGIPTAVRNDLNGRTFSKDASITEYCDYICNLFSNFSRYKALCLSSFNEYKTRLNWNVAGRNVKQLLVENCL